MFLAGWILLLIAAVWSLVVTFKQHAGWGIATVFLYPLPLFIFVFKHRQGIMPLVLSIIAFGLIIANFPTEQFTELLNMAEQLLQ